MKKLRVKKELGNWYYKKITPKQDHWLNGTIYELYNEQMEHIYTCCYYSSLLYFVETGRDCE